MACSVPVFRDPGWEQHDALPSRRHGHTDADANLDRARRRAAARVRDLALCTKFTHFVTLTLSQDKIDRYDMNAVMRSVNRWLDNRVRRAGLCYVLVPELHRDGAIHFHGFFNDALEMVDSGTISIDGSKKPRKPRSAAQRSSWLLADGGHVVYNVPDWQYGFSTAIALYGEYPKAISYVCKYIGKESEKIGGRWYYSGGALGAPEVTLCDVDIRELQEAGGYTFSVAGKTFCVKRGLNDE